MKIILNIIAVFIVACFIAGFLSLRPIKLTNYCDVKSITSDSISLTACVVDNTLFALRYTNSDEVTFTLDADFDGSEVYLYYYVDTDTYSLYVRNDEGTCGYLPSFSSGIGACSTATESVKDYTLELFEEFANKLGRKSYSALAEFFDDYIEDNYQE